DPYISAAFDFDFRDFLDCNDLSSPLLTDPYDLFPTTLSSTYTDKNFIVNSNITISAALELNGCQLAIHPHDPPYTITVSGTGNLQLLASAINSTKLFACSEMWGGINVQTNGLLNIEGVDARPTEIHDAFTGVYNNDGTSWARFAVFDHNYVGMHFENGSHFNASPMATEGISAVEFRCSGGEIKLPPYTGEPSNTHILLENVVDIRIGGINAPNPGGLTNSFTDAVYGIRSINSKFSLYNSEFDRMQNFSDVHPCFTCGAGIYAENTTSGSFEMKIGTKNGLSSTFLKNTFMNSKIGIFTKGNFALDSDDNNFEDLVTGIRSNRNNSIITIHDNNFERVNNGVIVFNSRGNMKINDNTFTTSTGLPPGVSFNNTAITIQNPISRFINQEVSVFGNTITDYRIGIHAINIPTPGIGIDIGTNTIASNEIIYNISNFPLTEYHGGIWLQNCPQARIFDNIISNTVFNADDNFRGIDIWSSVLTDVNCNDITNLGVGISFFDDCRNSQLRSNVITEFNRGVWLNGVNGQGMINLVQGVPGISNSNSAWDNVWTFNDPANNMGQFKVDGLVVGNQKINWYHQDADSPGITWSPNPWNGSMVNPFPSQNSAIFTCLDILRSAGDSRIANFGPVIGDTVTYGEYNDQLRYLARNTTYTIMKIDSSIVNVGDSLDVYFEAFYNQLDTSNSGVLYNIQSLLETIPDSALLLIEAMVPENELEEKLLAFYHIYLDALYADDNLSATDSAEVLEWTQGNLALSGEVYFNSLASMFEEKHPELISLRSSGSPSNSVENTVVYSIDNVEVFPNPADQSVTVKMANASSVITKIQVINSMGKVVATYAPDNSTYLLNLKGIAPGLYFLKIYCLDTEYNKKIQILR
ncbi:MAG: T9SS type A sorting domain-containing protein, partial [Bacteroidia bacterium]|nr:T9SS type A sorting domain-containing protein [Bacteroidia bacterium]